MNRHLRHITEALEHFVSLGVLLHHPQVVIPHKMREALPDLTVDDVVGAMAEFERMMGGRAHDLDGEIPALMDCHYAQIAPTKEILDGT